MKIKYLQSSSFCFGLVDCSAANTGLMSTDTATLRFIVKILNVLQFWPHWQSLWHWMIRDLNPSRGLILIAQLTSTCKFVLEIHTCCQLQIIKYHKLWKMELPAQRGADTIMLITYLTEYYIIFVGYYSRELYHGFRANSGFLFCNSSYFDLNETSKQIKLARLDMQCHHINAVFINGASVKESSP